MTPLTQEAHFQAVFFFLWCPFFFPVGFPEHVHVPTVFTYVKSCIDWKRFPLCLFIEQLLGTSLVYLFFGQWSTPAQDHMPHKFPIVGRFTSPKLQWFFSFFDEFSPTGWSFRPWGDVFLTQRLYGKLPSLKLTVRPNRKGSYSNHPFSGVLAVSFREGMRLMIMPCVAHLTSVFEALQPWNACCLWQGTIPWHIVRRQADGWLHDCIY